MFCHYLFCTKTKTLWMGTHMTYFVVEQLIGCGDFCDVFREQRDPPDG